MLLGEFEDFKAETISNFDAIKHQLQANQVDNASKCDLIVQMLEGIQDDIQSMRHQLSLSPVRFSNPPSEDSPPPSSFGDNANAENEPIDTPMASPNQLRKESEEVSIGDAPPQANIGTDLQMDLNDHLTVQHSPEIIHITESDEEHTHAQTEVIKEEMAEVPIEDMVQENVQQTEQSIDEFVEELVQQIKQFIDESVEAPIEETVEEAGVQDTEEVRTEVQPEDSATNSNPEDIRYDTTEDAQAPEQDQPSGAKSPKIPDESSA